MTAVSYGSGGELWHLRVAAGLRLRASPPRPGRRQPDCLAAGEFSVAFASNAVMILRLPVASSWQTRSRVTPNRLASVSR